jgi:hypothetical protein
MKNVALACAALVVLAGMVASASAAERTVSKSTLSSMGLGSMQLMSDNDGLAIRGKGQMGGGSGTSASVWGEGTANYRGQTSTNGYQASSHHSSGPSSAVGGNISVAGTVKVYVNNNGFSVHANLGVAGGASFASAH